MATFLLLLSLLLVNELHARQVVLPPGPEVDPPVNHHRLLQHLASLPHSTWVARSSPRFVNTTLSEVKRMCGTRTKPPVRPLPRLQTPAKPLDAIPTNFDARQKWPQCADIIGHIRDQASCGSCWAFASTEAFNDRMCIASNGKFKTLLSVQDTTSCCNMREGCFMSQGCFGGQPTEAWQFFVDRGVVSGGDYPDIGKGTSCYPYEFPMCAHHVNNPNYPNCTGEGNTPTCAQQCPEKKYPKPWAQDSRRAGSAFSLEDNIAKIQTEIMTNGPITGAFLVYADFPLYHSGVYKHESGEQLGGHAIKILGWGEETQTITKVAPDGTKVKATQSVPYWLVANSWNPTWGDKGYFKILRGVDECGIESMELVGGMPKAGNF